MKYLKCINDQLFVHEKEKKERPDDSVPIGCDMDDCVRASRYMFKPQQPPQMQRKASVFRRSVCVREEPTVKPHCVPASVPMTSANAPVVPASVGQEVVGQKGQVRLG